MRIDKLAVNFKLVVRQYIVLCRANITAAVIHLWCVQASVLWEKVILIDSMTLGFMRDVAHRAFANQFGWMNGIFCALIVLNVIDRIFLWHDLESLFNQLIQIYFEFQIFGLY